MGEYFPPPLPQFTPVFDEKNKKIYFVFSKPYLYLYLSSQLQQTI